MNKRLVRVQTTKLDDRQYRDDEQFRFSRTRFTQY